MLLRFVTDRTHPPYGHRSGVLQLAYDLRDGLDREQPAFEQLDSDLRWLERNLETSDRFTASKYPRAQESAISWIKSTATEHVVRLRRVSVVLEEMTSAKRGEIRTTRPGYVVFEDEHQVVAQAVRGYAEVVGITGALPEAG